jgi:sec-independent protein translocase protein TatA
MLGLFDNPIHLMMVLVVVMLLFGAKRLPEVGRSLGSGLRGFKESVSGEELRGATPELVTESAPPDHGAGDRVGPAGSGVKRPGQV